MYQKIVAYKMLHKNTIVPFHYQEDPKLGRWVCHQRLRHKDNSILPKRVYLLKSIGFDLEGAIATTYYSVWTGMFENS